MNIETSTTAESPLVKTTEISQTEGGETTTPQKVSEAILSEPSVTVLPPDMAETCYESMKAIADNLKPSEKITRLKAQREKEIRKKERVQEIREKDDLKKEIEAQQVALQNRA